MSLNKTFNFTLIFYETLKKNDFVTTGFSQKELNMTEEEKLNQLAFEDSDEEVTDPTIAIAHYNPKDERDICRIFLARGHCFKGDYCRFSHKALNPGKY